MRKGKEDQREKEKTHENEEVKRGKAEHQRTKRKKSMKV
jgi:hypothetical protein